MRALHSLVGSTVNALCKVSIAHCREIKLGVLADVYCANNILNGYARCQELCLAHKVFDNMPHIDTVSWNTMIAGHVNYGDFEAAWKILRIMKRCGFDFDGYTFGSILKGVACALRYDLGQQVHSMIVKIGFASNVYSGSALLDMYAKCGRVEEAYMVFKFLPERNSVSWNALIAGYVQVGDRSTTFWLLNYMEQEGMQLEDGTYMRERFRASFSSMEASVMAVLVVELEAVEISDDKNPAFIVGGGDEAKNIAIVATIESTRKLNNKN